MAYLLAVTLGSPSPTHGDKDAAVVVQRTIMVLQNNQWSWDRKIRLNSNPNLFQLCGFEETKLCEYELSYMEIEFKLPHKVLKLNNMSYMTVFIFSSWPGKHGKNWIWSWMNREISTCWENELCTRLPIGWKVFCWVSFHEMCSSCSFPGFLCPHWFHGVWFYLDLQHQLSCIAIISLWASGLH